MAVKDRHIFRHLKRGIPRKLRTGDFPYMSVLYTLAFSAVFMLLYQPFSSSAWFSMTTLRLAGLTMLFFSLSVIVLLVSKSMFIDFCRTRAVRLWQYIAWSIVEFLAIALLYVGFTLLFSLGNYSSSLTLIVKAIPCVALILLIPYSAIFLLADHYQSLSDDASDSLSETSVSNGGNRTLKERMINFADDSGILRFSIDIDSILYIKSEGNYVNLFYEKGENLESYMMRIPISSLETRLSGSPIVRCQRSYLVNTRRIRMMQNDGKSSYIIIDNDRVPVIPMSQTYASAVSDALSNRVPFEG